MVTCIVLGVILILFGILMLVVNCDAIGHDGGIGLFLGIVSIAIGILMSVIVPRVSMHKQLGVISYSPLTVVRDLDKDYVVITYDRFGDIQQDSHGFSFGESSIRSRLYEGSDKSKLINKLSDSNIVIQCKYGTTIRGKFIVESPIMKILADNEVENFKLTNTKKGE